MQSVYNWIDTRVESDKENSQLISKRVWGHVRAEQEQQKYDTVWDPCQDVYNTDYQGHPCHFSPNEELNKQE